MVVEKRRAGSMRESMRGIMVARCLDRKWGRKRLAMCGISMGLVDFQGYRIGYDLERIKLLL
jgi:hypothetical protein